MSRITSLLAGLYAVAAVILLRCAGVSADHGRTAYCLFFSSTAILFGLAIAHHAYHRDELRAARARLEREARPRPPRSAADEVVAVALAAACCEAWWTSAGAQHDASCSKHERNAA